MAYKAKIEEIFEDFKKDAAAMIEIPSILDEKDEKYLFGEEVQKALTKILEIADRMGFTTYRDPQGYYGYAQIGEGKELFGVLGHVDVVPTGEVSEWVSNPFTLHEQDGYLYGRGISDDKGPVLAGMYALKLLLDEGYTLNQRVRFIFGVDEENLWRCVKKYVEKEEHPSMGFTPDSTFPLIYAEKGLIQFNIINKQPLDIELHGGGAFNAVPDYAVLNKKDQKVIDGLQAKNRHITISDDKVEVHGKAMHAKNADEGENAVVYLIEELYEEYKDNNMVRFVVEKALNPNGKLIYGDVEDEVSGKLMMNVGIAEFGREKQVIGVDFRFPVTYSVEDIRSKLKEVVQAYGMELEEYDYLRSIYVEKDSFLIKKLMSAYQEVTGDLESGPISSGGATYARALENVVAFGAKLPNSVSTEHQVNERVGIDDMKTAIEIYMTAFRELVMN